MAAMVTMHHLSKVASIIESMVRRNALQAKGAHYSNS